MDVVDRENHTSRRRSYEVGRLIVRPDGVVGVIVAEIEGVKSYFGDLDRERAEIFTLMIFSGFQLQFWRSVKGPVVQSLR